MSDCWESGGASSAAHYDQHDAGGAGRCYYPALDNNTRRHQHYDTVYIGGNSVQQQQQQYSGNGGGGGYQYHNNHQQQDEQWPPRQHNLLSQPPPPPGLFIPNQSQYFYNQYNNKIGGAPPGFRNHAKADNAMGGEGVWYGGSDCAGGPAQGWPSGAANVAQQQNWSSGFIPTMVYQSSASHHHQQQNPSGSSSSDFLNGDSSVLSWKTSGSAGGSGGPMMAAATTASSPASQHMQENQQQQQQTATPGSGSLVGNTYRRNPKSNNGLDRLYRHPRQYNNTNWSNHQQHQEHPNNTGGKNAKLEGRKKLLAEAASLLSGATSASSPASAPSPSSSTTSQYTPANNNNNYTKQNNNYNNRKEGGSTNSWRHSQQESGYHSKRSDNASRNNGDTSTNNHQQFSGWRDRDQRHQNKPQQVADSVSQRERLMEQLSRGSLECLVCCDRIRQSDRVWSCSNCHHVLHLKCIVKWASTSKAENGWRCPACQNVTLEVPEVYKCMCGKVTDPQWVRGETPHTCGQMCGKTSGCIHQCTLLCHPGPCPQCSATVERECGCGRTKRMVMCSSIVEISCDSVCSKLLNCGRHYCQAVCHQGDCSPCHHLIDQVCYCGAQSRVIECGGERDSTSDGTDYTKYSCQGTCPAKLKCGHHPCTRTCHPGMEEGGCGDCRLEPGAVECCPCGKERLSPGSRTSCLDPIPTCGAPCSAQLPCGQPGNRHKCKAPCHEGDCPPCDLTTRVMCRCAAIEKEIACSEITSRVDSTTCQKRCTKKRSCGKHKCNQLCCIEVEHVCPLPCNKTLTCGRHKCHNLCHKGHCNPCTHASFEELRCECGKSVILPPVACGTRAPECKSACPRRHDCDHPPLHTCHSAPNCPPCMILTTKLCYGGHEVRKTVPCHIAEFSCGRPCGKQLEGCSHTCQKVCHGGACLEPAKPCTQPCPVPRTVCGHPCAAPCHSAPAGKVQCPSGSACLAKVRVTCECGRRTTTRTCQDNSSEYQRIATSLLASKMADVQLGLSVDTDIKCASKMSLKTLECNDECKIYERNLRLAIGLQIANPDLSSKLNPPKYTDTMKARAKKDPRFCQMVHDKLTQLVQLAKESKQKSRSYSFDPMNRDKRQFVHEYCKHFGCESVAYDTEPKRNIVATAYKDKSWLPSYSLLEVIQRENGQRKVPLPSLKIDSIKDMQMRPLQKASQMCALPTTGGGATTVSPSCSSGGKTHEPPPIDYFDYTN